MFLNRPLLKEHDMKRSSLNVSLGLLGAVVSVLLVPGCSFELFATGDLPADTGTPPIDDNGTVIQSRCNRMFQTIQRHLSQSCSPHHIRIELGESLLPTSTPESTRPIVDLHQA